MYSTYHFKTADEIDTSILEAIKAAFKGKSIVITVEEEKERLYHVPEWQQEIVLERQQYYNQHPEQLLDWNEAQNTINLD